jgi:predicted PurR-regulated permease PerM
MFDIENTASTAESRPLRRLTVLVWILVIAILVAFGYFASSLCITFLLSGFLAILLDPIPTALERAYLPRTISSAVVVLTGIAAISLLAYTSYSKGSALVDSIPEYATEVRGIIAPVTRGIERVRKSAGSLAPVEPSKKVPEVRINEAPNWPSYLVRGVSSVWGAVIIACVVPFLTFFMLVRKDHIYAWLSNTFGKTVEVPRFVNGLTQMVRGFVLGNLVIGSAMAAVIAAQLALFHMQGATIIGAVSGFLNLIPFVGAVLAVLLPLTAGTTQFHTAGPFVAICVTVPLLHLISANLLVPRWIGKRVNVGPVAATAGLLFWGWLWGVMGVILGVPLTALVKLIADCHPALAPISNLLAETPRAVPSWSSAAPAAMTRVIPYFRRRISPPEKD